MSHDLLSRKRLIIFPLLFLFSLLLFPVYLSSSVSQFNTVENDLIVAVDNQINTGLVSTENPSNAPINRSDVPISISTIEEEALGEIDLIATNPATQNGAIIAEISDTKYHSDGSATANIVVRNVTSLWYKLYIEEVGDIDFSFSPLILEDEQGKYLFLSPEGSSDYAYPALNSTVTFNEPDATLFFTADRSIESGIGALFLQQLEILSRAHSAIPALPKDEAGAIIEVIKANNEGLGPFIDVGTAIYEGDFSGILSGMSALGRSPEALVQLKLAFQKIGHDITNEMLVDATSYLRILGLTWYIGDFVGQSLGFASADNAQVTAIDSDDGSSETNVNAQISVTGNTKPAPVQLSFDASGSYASDGIESYQWDFDDGSPTENGLAAENTFNQPGSYRVTLTVTDTNGNIEETSQIVQILEPRFVVERQGVYEFNFTAETHEIITGYSWDFGDGNTASGLTVNHTYDSLGEYEATLTLNLSDGETTDISHTIFAGPHSVQVSGTIDSDEIWYASEGEYILENDVTVAEGATLTIEPGVDVLLPSETTDLEIYGTLVAEGTAQDSIRFRPGPEGDRFGGNIQFYSTSEGSILSHVNLFNLSGWLNNGAISVYETDGLLLTNSTIAGSETVGIHLDDGARPEIRDNSFSENEDEDIQVHTANSLANVGANDLETITVRGTITEPILWRLNNQTQYILEGDVTVAEGATLTIEPGVDVMLPSETTDLEVEGTLLAEGTAQDSIRFRPGPTGDNYGGNIQFRSSSVSSVLNNVAIINLTGGNNSGSVSIYGTGDVFIGNSTFSGSWESGLYIDDGASPIIRRNRFIDNHYGVIVSGSSTPDLGLPTEDGQNIFIENTEYAVQNNTSGSILAVGNFWNSTSPSVIDNRIYDDDEDSDSGPVIFEPFLDEAPDFDNGSPDPLTITSIEPKPVIGSHEDQQLTVHGSGFEDGAFVILDDLEDDQGSFENPENTTFIDSTKLRRRATFTENAATWSAQVKNPDGSRSDTVHFEVTAPNGNIRVSSLPVANSFRMPIGKVDKSEDLGNNLSLLTLSVWDESGYPKIRFNDNGDQSADINEWYVATAHNKNQWLFEGVFSGEIKSYTDSNGIAFHPGEDWNTHKGGNSDEGAPVFSIARGIVLHNGCVNNYGRTFIIAHKTKDNEIITSMYAHLKSSESYAKGSVIQKGVKIGEIGATVNANCEPGPSYHLHFEIRNDLMLNSTAIDNGNIELKYEVGMWPATGRPDGGQNFIDENYYSPSEFIATYSSDENPLTPPTGLTASNSNGNIELSWDANTEQDLAGYNLYRSASLFSDPAVANKINNSAVITEVSYTDDNIEKGTTYYYRLTSVAGNGNESPLSPWISYVNEALNVSNEWIMVSNPTLQEKNLSDVQAFSFDRTYQRDSVLSAGKGYWIKSNTGTDIAFQDQGIDSIAIELDQGWNMVGSLVDTIHIKDIDDPGAVIGSIPVYSYDIDSGNYQETTQLLPKKGYWLYAEGSGDIHLNFNSDAQNAKKKPSQITGNEIIFDKIVFEHANSKQQLLYSNNPLNEQRYLLPPVPPQPSLDVRTSGSLKATGADKTSLTISSSTYPIQVSLEKNLENNVAYQLSAHEGKDKILLTLTSANSLQIKESYEQISIKRISKSEVPLENKLLPNYPNPFNPTTTIKYEVANTSNVEIKVYDALGREVRTLVNQQRQPGIYTTNFNGRNLASGLYFIKINAGQYLKVQKMTLIK